MNKCPNCDEKLTSAPWRYDDEEHGVHWVCPTDERLQTEVIYAPIPLAQALDEFLKEHPRRQAPMHTIG